MSSQFNKNKNNFKKNEKRHEMDIMNKSFVRAY